jgi:predicted nucleotidyltransferase
VLGSGIGSRVFGHAFQVKFDRLPDVVRDFLDGLSGGDASWQIGDKSGHVVGPAFHNYSVLLHGLAWRAVPLESGHSSGYQPGHRPSVWSRVCETSRAWAPVSRENEGAMTLHELRTTKRDEILRIAALRGARNVRVFGSVARGDNDARSDIDFLVDLEPDRSLFDLSGLLLDLEAVLHSQVDVVTERGLRSRIRDRVLQEAVPL